jgi:hypothetical protein
MAMAADPGDRPGRRFRRDGKRPARNGYHKKQRTGNDGRKTSRIHDFRREYALETLAIMLDFSGNKRPGGSSAKSVSRRLRNLS